jgi:hypothetical protein
MHARPNCAALIRLLSWTVAIVIVCAAVARGGRIQESSDVARSRLTAFSPATISARRHYFGAENVDASGAVRRDRVILSWTGVSSFAASLNGHVVLLDAWIPRGAPCYPHLNQFPGAGVQMPLCITAWPHSMKYVGTTDTELAALAPSAYFFGHAHFDHAGDLPTVIRSNPAMVVFGAQEHCDDIAADTALKLPAFKCVPVFKAGAGMGSIAKLPPNTLSGVKITAVKQPHSAPDRRPGAASPQDAHAAQLKACTGLTAFPVSPNEPFTWLAPHSGSLAVAWHFQLGNFSLMWQDTAGPIHSGNTYTSIDGLPYEGAQVIKAFESLPRPDVRLALSGSPVLSDHMSALGYPKVLVPVHGDPCSRNQNAAVQRYLQELPADKRPTVRFLSDPDDYVKPIVFDPASPQWRK